MSLGLLEMAKDGTKCVVLDACLVELRLHPVEVLVDAVPEVEDSACPVKDHLHQIRACIGNGPADCSRKRLDKRKEGSVIVLKIAGEVQDPDQASFHPHRHAEMGATSLRELFEFRMLSRIRDVNCCSMLGDKPGRTGHRALSIEDQIPWDEAGRIRANTCQREAMSLVCGWIWKGHPERDGVGVRVLGQAAQRGLDTRGRLGYVGWKNRPQLFWHQQSRHVICPT